MVLTTPLLEGLDGVKNMFSKSLGNYIGVAEPPAEQFGKVMRIPDALLERYAPLTTGWHPDRVEEFTGALARGDLGPNEAKLGPVGRTVVDLYHGPGAGDEAEAAFNQVFKKHEVPDDVPEFELQPDQLMDGRIRLARLLALAGPGEFQQGRCPQDRRGRGAPQRRADHRPRHRTGPGRPRRRPPPGRPPVRA